MNDMISVVRSFAYDSIRIDNLQRHVGVDYIEDGHHQLDKSILREYGDCNAIPFHFQHRFTPSFIPLPALSSNYQVFSRLEIHEQLLKTCMAAVDAHPTDSKAWVRYVEAYESFAEEAETRKEKVSMLQMENELLGDALKKIPKNPQLVNAKVNVMMNVRVKGRCEGQLKSGEELNNELFDLLLQNLDDGVAFSSALHHRISLSRT